MRPAAATAARLTALCWLVLGALACPLQCVCKWKSGKRHVECADRKLPAIPDALDPETQVLDFSGNELQILQRETFSKLGLIDLQKIYLPRCKLQKIDSHAFKGLANLVELDLSNNYLTVVPSTNFVFLPSLMRLSLSNNPITTVKSHCFQHLAYLNTLELSFCKIDTVEKEAFFGLNHLEWLKLNDNRITSIQGDKIFPDTLRGIDLQNNNWLCDCNLQDLYEWLLNFNMPHAVEPVCSHPEHLKKRTIVSVEKTNLACLPVLSPTSLHLDINAGSNVTLECFVQAVPEAKITWLHEGKVILNHSGVGSPIREMYYTESGFTEKKSELYIYNVGADHNGTFRCVAQNAAGRVDANYTLRIIIKEEPVVVVVTFPYRHLVVIVTAVFLIIVLLIAVIAVVLLKFKTDTKTRKKKESGKDVAMCNQILPNRNGTLPKNNGSLIVNAHSHHALQYTLHEPSDMFQSNNIKGFVDRNPDLINDAETVANTSQNSNTMMSVYTAQAISDSVEDETTFSESSQTRQVTWQDQQSVVPMNNMPVYQHSADVHLNPGCFLDSDGYPYDYGLPKHPCRAPLVANYATVGPFYQTLPHNRSKAQKSACKFANDNEFNIRPCNNFEASSHPIVRRTLEGYPVPRNRQVAFVGNGTVYYNEEFIPSPPEGYKAEPLVQCCGPADPRTWMSPKGTCAVMVPVGVTEGPGRCYQVETRCVDTQTATSDARAPGEGTDSVLKPLPQVSNAKCMADLCSESPDEGYVGDGNDI